MGKYTERLKDIMRREGIRTFRQGGKKLEYKVKENIEKKKNNEKNKEEEGVVYRVSCKNCNKIYIGETKFKMKKWIEEHKKDVGYERIRNNAEFSHEIDWEKKCLEKEKRLFPRKILESLYIKENKERCMNLNEVIGVNTIYGRGKDIWIKRKNKEFKKRKKCV